jgi:uncharacterized integral membrane protein (TIGR00697 family)
MVGVICSLVATKFDLTTLRIAIGSGVAFLLAQLSDVAIFHRLRLGSWWRAPLVSTLFSSTLDTAIFFTVAFSGIFTFLEPSVPTDWAGEMVPFLTFGPNLPLWVSLAAADWCVKMALALVALVPFRVIVARLA